jgi:hypothetical protein
MAQTSPVVATNTFVVRLWREWSAPGPRWRGHIEHVQSGESAEFLDLDAILDFIRRIAAMPEGNDRR